MEVGEKSILQHNPAGSAGVGRAGRASRYPSYRTSPSQVGSASCARLYDIHTVTQGETLYGISRKYEIPIQTVIEDNPNLDPAHLRSGSAS